MRWVQAALPFDPDDEEPVVLPEGMDHGRSHGAYSRYKCRCWRCKAFRRSYDRERYELIRRTDEFRRQKAEYDRARRSK